MKPFDYRRAGSAEEASACLANGHAALAGGTDLVPLLKDGLRAPGQVVDLKHAGLPRGIAREGDQVTIGALTTIAELEREPRLKREFPLLAQAASLTATRQLRNRATIGGNLLQESRCWYFRNPDLNCWLKGGETCYARAGRNERHAVIGESTCITTQPSDLAGCLVALDATVELESADGSRELSLARMLTVPEDTHRSLTVLGDGELVTRVRFPADPPGRRSIYLKAMSRKAWSFALVGAAVVLCIENGRIVSANAALNGVAPMPWSPASTTASTPGELIRAWTGEFDRAATPRQHNGYKLPLARALLTRAVRELTDDS